MQHPASWGLSELWWQTLGRKGHRCNELGRKDFDKVSLVGPQSTQGAVYWAAKEIEGVIGWAAKLAWCISPGRRHCVRCNPLGRKIPPIPQNGLQSCEKVQFVGPQT